MVNLDKTLTYHDQNYLDYGPILDNGSGLRIRDRNIFLVMI